MFSKQNHTRLLAERVKEFLWNLSAVLDPPTLLLLANNSLFSFYDLITNENIFKSANDDGINALPNHSVEILYNNNVMKL